MRIFKKNKIAFNKIIANKFIAKKCSYIYIYLYQIIVSGKRKH